MQKSLYKLPNGAGFYLKRGEAVPAGAVKVVRYEYEIQSNWAGDLWDTSHTVDTRAEALQSVREYRKNAPEARHRIKRMRV